jgi:hypothetical protein
MVCIVWNINGKQRATIIISSASLKPTKDMVVRGSVSATASSRRTRFVRSVKKLIA